jgi:large subunit ribosomal protein L22
MEATAKVTGVRIAPRKVMLVIDLIRGKKVSDALGILANLNKSSSPVVAKLVKSAAANAVNNNKMDESKLYIKRTWDSVLQEMRDWIFVVEK